MHLLDKRSTRALPVALMIHDNSTDRTALVPATHHSNFCPINFRWGGSASPPHGEHRSARPYCQRCAPGLNWPGRSSGAVTLKKLECSKSLQLLVFNEEFLCSDRGDVGGSPSFVSVFQDGPDGEPAGRRPEHAGAVARRDSACWVPRSRRDSACWVPRSRRRRLHGRIKGPGLGRHHDPRRSTPRADWRTGSRRSISDRGASPAPIRFPPDNFKHSLTLFSKSFSSFPRGTCSLSVSRPYLALDGIYRPIRAALPNNPTRRQRLVVRQGPGTMGLSPSSVPLSRRLRPGPPLRTLHQTTIRTPRVTDFQAGLFPVRSPLLRESFGHVSAAHTPRTRVRQQTTTFSFQFLGVINAGGCSFCREDTGSYATGSRRGRGAMMRPHPLPLMFDNTFTGRSARQVSTKILPQRTAHVAAIRTLHRTIQSVGATGGVYKGQGRSQRELFVIHKSKNFTSDYEIRMPPTVPVNHYSDPEGQHNRIRIQLRPGAHRRQ
ncbi:hypothetical protein V6N13_029639 [Hibiscus sabdariffa]